MRKCTRLTTICYHYNVAKRVVVVSAHTWMFFILQSCENSIRKPLLDLYIRMFQRILICVHYIRRNR